MTAPAGFDALYTRQHERLVTALVLAGSDQEAAEDIAHEAFIRVLLAWRRIREPDGYLYRTAFRLQGRARRRSVKGALVAATTMRRAEPRTEDSVANRDEVEQTLALLTSRQRACAVLVHYLGCSTEEAAEHLGITPGTVRVHLHDARATLRAAGAEDIEIH